MNLSFLHTNDNLRWGVQICYALATIVVIVVVEVTVDLAEVVVPQTVSVLIIMKKMTMIQQQQACHHAV